MKTLLLLLPLRPLLSQENQWQRSLLTSQVLHQLCPHGQVPQQCPHGQNLQSPQGQSLMLLLLLQSPQLLLLNNALTARIFKALRVSPSCCSCSSKVLSSSPKVLSCSGKVLNTCTSGYMPKDNRHLYCLWCLSKFLSCTKIFIRPHPVED